MEKGKQILEAIKAKTADSQAILNKETPTYAEIETVRGLNAEIKTLQSQFEAVKESDGLKSWLNEPANAIPVGGFGGSKDMETLGFTKAGHGDFEFDNRGRLKSFNQIGQGTFGEKTWKAIGEDAYSNAFGDYLRKGERGIGQTTMKDLSEGVDPAGGYLVPAELIARIIQRKPTPTRVAGLVSTINTSRDAVEMPKLNYSAGDLYSTGFRTTWTGEVAPSTGAPVDDSNLFGTIRIPVHQAMISGAMTKSLLEDSAFDVMGWFTSKFSETADLLADQMALVGNGVVQPYGILVNPGGTADDPATVLTGTSGVVTPAGLIDLDYSLPEQYINADSLAYVMNRTDTARKIAKLVDGQQRFLFAMGMANDGGLQGKRPDSLLGKPITYSGFMPNVAANAYPIIFGDLSGYARVVRLGLSVQVLYETLAKKGMVEVVGRLRFGGRVIEPWKLKIQKVSP